MHRVRLNQRTFRAIIKFDFKSCKCNSNTRRLLDELIALNNKGAADTAKLKDSIAELTVQVNETSKSMAQLSATSLKPDAQELLEQPKRDFNQEFKDNSTFIVAFGTVIAGSFGVGLHLNQIAIMEQKIKTTEEKIKTAEVRAERESLERIFVFNK